VRIQILDYAYLAVIAIAFVSILIYFPNKPPTPPTKAALIIAKLKKENASFGKGLFTLFC
jgi:hypothetical protein